MGTPAQNISALLSQSPVKSARLTGLVDPSSPVSMMTPVGSASNAISLPTVSTLGAASPSLVVPASPSADALARIPGFSASSPLRGSTATPSMVGSAVGSSPQSLRSNAPKSSVSGSNRDFTAMLSQMTPVPLPSPSPPRRATSSTQMMSPSNIPTIQTSPSSSISPVNLSPVTPSPRGSTLSGSVLPTVHTLPTVSSLPSHRSPSSASALHTVRSHPTSSALPTVAALPTVRSLPSHHSPSSGATLPTVSTYPTSPSLPTVSSLPSRRSYPTNGSSIKLPTVTPDIEASGIGLATKSQSYGNTSSNPMFHTPSQLMADKRSRMTGSVGRGSSGIQFSTESGMVQDQSIEDQLATFGYITTDRILTKSPNGIENRYLKTVNERGQVVYVEPDMEGYVSVSPGDRTMIESKSASKIPVSARIGTLDCAGMDVCGVAFECEGELCTVTREDSSMTPTELVLHTVGKSVDRSVVEEGTPIAYPIVRLSEIIASPVQVVESVDAATVRIRNASYQSCVDDMNKINLGLDAASGNFKTLVGSLDDAFKRLGESVNDLEALRAGYDAVPPQNDDQRAKLRKITFNLHRRHDMLTDLLRLCKTVSAYGDYVNEIGGKFTDFTDHVDTAYKDVKYVYDE